jgi:hypothetical protein
MNRRDRKKEATKGERKRRRRIKEKLEKGDDMKENSMRKEQECRRTN